MIVALVRAFGWQHKLERGNLNIQELAQLEQMDRSYMGKIIRLTCLAPDIVESILAGLQPRNLTLKDLIRNTIPVDWNEQRKMFGFRQEYTIRENSITIENQNKSGRLAFPDTIPSEYGFITIKYRRSKDDAPRQRPTYFNA